MNPNKTKQKSLDFLGFIFPNRDFSKGYSDSRQKIRRPRRSPAPATALAIPAPIPYSIVNASYDLFWLLERNCRKIFVSSLSDALVSANSAASFSRWQKDNNTSSDFLQQNVE
jgi:hypothetical protein